MAVWSLFLYGFVTIAVMIPTAQTKGDIIAQENVIEGKLFEML